MMIAGLYPHFMRGARESVRGISSPFRAMQKAKVGCMTALPSSLYRFAARVRPCPYRQFCGRE